MLSKLIITSICKLKNMADTDIEQVESCLRSVVESFGVPELKMKQKEAMLGPIATRAI